MYTRNPPRSLVLRGGFLVYNSVNNRKIFSDFSPFFGDFVFLQKMGNKNFQEKISEINLKWSISDTWRGRRDLNPRAGFIQPTPLAGEPLRPLGYFRRSMVFYKIGGESGIRTHGDLRLAGFQDRFLQPLGHLSMKRQECPSFRRLIRLPQLVRFVNRICKTFPEILPRGGILPCRVQNGTCFFGPNLI